MRLVCSTGAVTRGPSFTQPERLSALRGICSRLELLLYPNWRDEMTDVHRELASGGFVVAAVHGDKTLEREITSREATDWERTLRWSCEVARDVGAPAVIIHAWSGFATRDEVAVALGRMARAAAVAADVGVKLWIEGVPCSEDSLTRRLRAFLAASDAFESVLDTEFLAHAGEIDLLSGNLLDELRVRHVHVKDYGGSLGSSAAARRYLHPGEGSLRWPPIFDALKTARVVPDVSIESSVVGEDGELDLARLRTTLQFVAAAGWPLER